MSLRRIVTISDADSAVLRQRTRKVRSFGAELEALANDMLETMRESYGLGLAAPQVGLPMRMFVAEVPLDEEEPEETKAYVFVNPKIIKASRQEVQREEGCLSIPGIYGQIWRADEVVVKAQDPHGKEFRLRARGLLARVIQHEVDHLDGILFVDRVAEEDGLYRYVEKDEELVTEKVQLKPGVAIPLGTRVLA